MYFIVDVVETKQYRVSADDAGKAAELAKAGKINKDVALRSSDLRVRTRTAGNQKDAE